MGAPHLLSVRWAKTRTGIRRKELLAELHQDPTQSDGGQGVGCHWQLVCQCPLCHGTPRAGKLPVPPRSRWRSARSVEKRVHPAEACPGLKMADMLIPLGVASKGSKPGGQHVHQPVVSRLRHPRLPVHPHRLSGRPNDLHHPPGPQDLPLLRLRLAPGPLAARSCAVPILAHRRPRRSWSCPSRASNVRPAASCAR